VWPTWPAAPCPLDAMPVILPLLTALCAPRVVALARCAVRMALATQLSVARHLRVVHWPRLSVARMAVARSILLMALPALTFARLLWYAPQPTLWLALMDRAWQTRGSVRPISHALLGRLAARIRPAKLLSLIAPTSTMAVRRVPLLCVQAVHVCAATENVVLFLGRSVRRMPRSNALTAAATERLWSAPRSPSP